MHFFRDLIKFLALLAGFLLSSADGLPFGSAILYKDTDPITQLNVLDLKSTILATSNAWLVEFYSSWCGHCIDFAPAFIQLANDVKGWEKVIKVAAVDCAKDENIPLCREYEVMGYPTLKFFPSFSEASQLGISWKGTKKVENIRHSMIDFIENEFKEKKASPHWPILETLENETLEDLWAHYNNEEIILLFEEFDNKDQYWSRESILDAYQFTPNYPPIRRVNASSRSDLVERYKVNSFPSFVFLERSGKSEVYNIKPSRDYLSKLMRKFFATEDKGLTADAVPTTKEPDHLRQLIKSSKDQVYMADIEGALLYAFGHEVSIHKNIAGKELSALKEFIRVLDDYFPGRPAIKEILKTIKRKLVSYKRNIPGEEFGQLWQEALGRNLFSKQWVGCMGSLPHLRGYPCSLWTLFHTLTVNYALQEPEDQQVGKQESPALILRAMKGYIKYFFGCAHCSNHFVDMTEDETSPLEGVRTRQQSVLWLWAAHNKVNRRIASDASEDPQAPKIQFPSTANCPGCLENEEKAYAYLLHLYSPDSISSIGLVSTLTEQGSGPHQSPAVGSGSGSIHSVQIGSLSFTSYDISLCAAIYFASSLILMIVLCRILIVKKRRVRKYVYEVFGSKF